MPQPLAALGPPPGSAPGVCFPSSSSEDSLSALPPTFHSRQTTEVLEARTLSTGAAFPPGKAPEASGDREGGPGPPNSEKLPGHVAGRDPRRMLHRGRSNIRVSTKVKTSHLSACLWSSQCPGWRKGGRSAPGVPGAQEPYAGRARVLPWAQRAPSPPSRHTGASAHLRGQAAAGQQSSRHVANLPHAPWNLSWQQQKGIGKVGSPASAYHPLGHQPRARSSNRHQRDGRGHTTAWSYTSKALGLMPADVGSPVALPGPVGSNGPHPRAPTPGTGGPKAQDQSWQRPRAAPDETRPAMQTSRGPCLCFPAGQDSDQPRPQLRPPQAETKPNRKRKKAQLFVFHFAKTLYVCLYNPH